MNLKYLIVDIDGTLTDGGVYYDENGNEIKKFCTKDGSGFVLVRTAGITPIIITGRCSYATMRRMNELGIRHVYQNISDKCGWLKKYISENKICKDEIGYIGDDLNDLAPMKLCGFVACPADAIEDVKNIADYVTEVSGGKGVVREVIRKILIDDGRWGDVLSRAFGGGV